MLLYLSGPVIDVLGYAIYALMIVAPVLSFWLAWKLIKGQLWARVLAGLIATVFIEYGLVICLIYMVAEHMRGLD